MKKMKRIVGIFTLSVMIMVGLRGQNGAKFIWITTQANERQVFVFFRNDVDIDANIQKAELCLFADSRYQLFVNGVMINFGPVRFYCEHPQYDSYDLTPYLKLGKNTIAVQALSNGVHTFQIPEHIGGFIAWGEIVTASGKSFNMETPGNWICKPVNGYDRTAPKVSFAQHIQESYDARKDPPGWNLPTTNLSDWNKPYLLTHQDAWGPLEPRILPFLTQNVVMPKFLLGVYELKNDIDIYSYRIKVPDENEHLFSTSFRLFAYTYIYSPKDQQADINGWWSEIWLNGDSISYSQPRKKFSKRIWHMNLKEGWNYVFIKYGTVEGYWDAYYGIDKKYNLVVSAQKKMDGDIIFYTAGPFDESEHSKVMSLKLPLVSPDKLPKLSASWVPQRRNSSAGNPVWETAWSEFGTKLNIHPSHRDDIVLSKPSALVYDMGEKQLARFFIDVDAPEGTIIDVAFTEDTLGNRPWIMKREMLNIGARFITREGNNHFETFNPYGCRFMQVNISHQSSPVTLHQTGMISQVYPFVKNGSFQCSDPILTSLWEMGWRTLRVCSEDSYDDTPFRERGLYAGDCMPEFASTMAISGDPLLIKRSLQLFHQMYSGLFTQEKQPSEDNYSNIGDFPMITTLYYGWYVNRTNDLDFARKLYSGYKTMITDAYEKNLQSNGLIFTKGIFVEWTKIRRENYCSTYANGLFARNCEILSSIAEKLGYTKDADWFSVKAKEIISAIKKNCWDQAKGAFCDGIADGKPLQSYYPIS